MTVSTTSTLMTGALCYPGTRSLYSIPGSSPKRLRRSYDGFDRPNGLNGQDSHDVQNGLDGHDNHSGPNGHNKVNAMNPAGAAGIRASHQEDGGRSPKDRWITPGDPVFRSRASWERFDFPEDFLLADASMTTKHMGFFRAKEDAKAAQRTMIKVFVARSRRSRMSPSRFPPIIRITPMSFLPTGATRAHQHQQSSYRPGR